MYELLTLILHTIQVALDLGLYAMAAGLVRTLR